MRRRLCLAFLLVFFIAGARPESDAHPYCIAVALDPSGTDKKPKKKEKEPEKKGCNSVSDCPACGKSEIRVCYPSGTCGCVGIDDGETKDIPSRGAD